MTDMDERPTMERLAEPERRPKNVARALAGIAWGVAVLAAGTAVAVGVTTHNEVTTARAAQHRAEVALKTEKAKPPKVVTKTVTKSRPVFGKSVLMGVFASGQIQTGVYDGSGNFSVTPNDSTCSMQYTQLSNQYATVTIDRPTFMSACEGSLNTTLKKDTAS